MQGLSFLTSINGQSGLDGQGATAPRADRDATAASFLDVHSQESQRLQPPRPEPVRPPEPSAQSRPRPDPHPRDDDRQQVADSRRNDASQRHDSAQRHSQPHKTRDDDSGRDDSAGKSAEAGAQRKPEKTRAGDSKATPTKGKDDQDKDIDNGTDPGTDTVLALQTDAQPVASTSCKIDLQALLGQGGETKTAAAAVVGLGKGGGKQGAAPLSPGQSDLGQLVNQLLGKAGANNSAVAIATGKGHGQFAQQVRLEGLNLSAGIDGSTAQGSHGGLTGGNSTAGTPGPGDAKAAAPNAALRSYSTSIDLPVQHAEWGDKVAGKLTWLAAQRVQAADIHITPADLGPLHVQVQVHNDQASVVIHSHNPAVRDLLENNGQRLRDMMQDGGMNLANFDVSSQAGQQQQQGQNGNAETGGSSSTVAGDAGVGALASTMEGETYIPVL